MLRFLYLIFIFVALDLSFSFASKPALPPDKKVILKTDSSTIKVRYFDKTAINNYRKQPEFQYNDNENQPSWWTRFWHWFWNWFKNLFDFSNFGTRYSSFFAIVFLILEYLIVLLAIAAIVFFILKLAGIDMLNIFKRKPLSANLPYSESLENIHEIDFDAEVEKAVSQHNYRLAVRMLYLKCLKQLSDATLIKWQPEKTNSAYINELNDAGQRTAFKLLTRQFEYVWYGEFAIDGNVYNTINFMFQNFKNDIA
jgi:ABC-type dipeptide/oligopeptide/nickel transport system permease component